ncbi:MAG: peptidoglycan-binding protein [Reyranella sp.]|nr:peptidoglycan-binding protein [Reyranella sp.]
MLGPYLEEIRAPILPLVIGSTDRGVKRVQEWLTLQGFATGIDGDFGPATRAALAAFQRSKGILREPPDGNVGIVDSITWGALIAPLVNAEVLLPGPEPFGDAVCRIARAHLAAKAREVGGDNRGPWVRLYGRGIDQSTVGFFPWCQVFANLPWFKAARELNLPLPFRLTDDAGNQSAYVPWVVNQARAAGRFAAGSTTQRIPPGSMFFVPGTIEGRASHIHVGLVAADDGQTIQTLEGNTNGAGGSNGYEVAARFRRKANCDYGVVG